MVAGPSRGPSRGPNFPFLGPLKKKIENKTVAPMVNMIRLDIFRFENQIPLGLIKNVFNMIMCTDRPSTSTSTPDTRHKLNFDTFVAHAVCSIYCDLPKPPNLMEFMLAMEELKFEERTHLLECLYLVVCYRPESSRNQPVSVDVGDVENQGATDPPQSSNGGDGGSRSQGTTGAQDDNGKSLHDDADPPQNSSSGGRDGTSGGAQRDKGKSPQGDEDPLQNSNGGGGDGPSGGAQRDKGKSPQVDVGPSQESNGGHGVGTSGGTQHEKGKSPQGDVDPGQSSNGGGVEGTRGTQGEKGKSPQGDVDPRQSSNGGGVEGTRGTQGEKGKSPQGDADPPQSNGGSGEGTSAAQHDTSSAQLPNSDGGAAFRNGFPFLVECTFTCPTICQGFQTHRNGQRRHNHAANIAVKRGDKTKWISEVNFRTSIFNHKGELYLPEFAMFDETQTLLKNLLVYEYTGRKERDLISFIHLLNNLIDTEEDVRRMKESGVLKNNSLGSDKEVAEMWNTMLSGFVIIPSRHYQFDVFDKIANHRKKFIPNLLGEVKTHYSKRQVPWKVVALLAAFVTIVATVLAVVYTIITYYYGNKQRAQT